MSGVWALVSPGDPFQPRAATWNALMQLGRASRVDQRRSGSPPEAIAFRTEAATVWCRNDSEDDIPAGGAVEITGPAIDPEASDDAFADRVVLAGRIADEPGPNAWTAIARTRISPGALGRVVIEGVVQARVVVNESWHRYAGLVDAEDTLHTRRFGPAEILWREPGSGTRWALVRIEPPSPPRSGVHLAQITAVTGTENAVYNAEALDDPSITVTNKTPLNRPLDADRFDWLPAAVGEDCLILQIVGPTGDLIRELVVLTEVVEDQECDEEEE